MPPPPDNRLQGGRDPAAPRHLSVTLVALLAVLAAPAILIAFGLAKHDGHSAAPRQHPSLISGSRPGVLSPAQLAEAQRAAIAFAHSYAASIYRPGPPRLRSASGRLAQTLARASVSIPATRVGLHPRVTDLRLQPESAGSALATATIDDGKSPPFSVPFSVQRRGSRWVVTALAGAE